jgi:hypothetical protein
VNTFRDLPNSATIQISTANGARQSVPCCFDGLDGKRLNLTSRERITSCTAVSVEYDDAMFLGEVLACTHNVDDSWHLEIKVEQVLTGLQSLMNLRARLLGEPIPEMATALAGRR